MLFGAWVFVGVIGIIATLGAVTTSDDAAAIVAGLVGTVAWGVWTFGTLDIERPIDGSPGLAFSEPALTLVGVALALLPLYVALTGPVELVGGATDASPEEV